MTWRTVRWGLLRAARATTRIRTNGKAGGENGKNEVKRRSDTDEPPLPPQGGARANPPLPRENPQPHVSSTITLTPPAKFEAA